MADLDHTADIQLHACKIACDPTKWFERLRFIYFHSFFFSLTGGKNLAEAFANVGVAMFGYMTKLDLVDIDPKCTTFIEVRGHDLDSLCLKYLEECLHLFSSNELIVKEIHVSNLDTEDFILTANLYGEKFNLDKHTQGTEVSLHLNISSFGCSHSGFRMPIFSLKLPIGQSDHLFCDADHQRQGGRPEVRPGESRSVRHHRYLITEQ